MSPDLDFPLHDLNYLHPGHRLILPGFHLPPLVEAIKLLSLFIVFLFPYLLRYKYVLYFNIVGWIDFFIYWTNKYVPENADRPINFSIKRVDHFHAISAVRGDHSSVASSLFNPSFNIYTTLTSEITTEIWPQLSVDSNIIQSSYVNKKFKVLFILIFEPNNRTISLKHACTVGENTM